MHKTWHKNTNLGAKVVFFLQICKGKRENYKKNKKVLHI